MIARDGQHIGDVLLLQPGAQRPVIPIGLVGGHPGERHPRADGPLDHQPGQLRLGRERRVSRNPGRLAAARVTGPGLRQVQRPVNQRVPARGSIAKVDRDLGVLDPARGAGVLPLHPRRGGAFLHVPRLINHQHRAGITQLLHDVTAHVVADPAGVPPGPGQQVLHPVRSPVPGMLGDRPAVLARQLGQQAQHERPGPAPRLHPAEPGTGPGHQLIECPQPAARVYAGASGRQKIIASHHKPR